MSHHARYPDYHRYLAHSPDSEPWGIAVTAAGRQHSAAGEPYPPPGHPRDHAFSWEKGRVLSACQIVMITEGRGRFEAKATGLREVSAGMAMVVLPGVWHRYAPDPPTGWAEQWMELRGKTVEQLIRRGALDQATAVVPRGRALELAACFTGVHARMQGDRARACDPERSALGLQALALVVAAQERAVAVQPNAELVARAEKLLAERVADAPYMPGIAREVGMAYSYFRREFKRHTGLSPQQYLNQLRLEAARRLLSGTNDPLKHIADRLGFSSPYHFSAAFKQRFGVAPVAWRRRSFA